MKKTIEAVCVTLTELAADLRAHRDARRADQLDRVVLRLLEARAAAAGGDA